MVSPPFWVGVARNALFLLAVVALTVAREVARLVVGRALGLRAAMVELGEGAPLARFRIGTLRWILLQTPIGGETIWEPPPPDLPVRGRLALLTLTRSAVAVATLLLLRAAGVPLGWSTEGSLVGRAFADAAECLLVLGLIPFAISGQSLIPFETDGMKLLKLLFGRAADVRQDFGRYYFAAAREALNEGDAARAAALCRDGATRQGPPWSDALRAYEATALARGGDPRAAMERAEAELARQLPPVARAVGLNDWSWYAFLARDEAMLRLADRRSADALVLKPDLPPVAGTRGAILLWQGRLSEALPLLERSLAGAHSTHARDSALSLLAIAAAAQGDVARAQDLLRQVRQGERTGGLWAEAGRAVEAAARPEVRLEAVRGSRVLVVSRDGFEAREATSRARQVASGDIQRVDIGQTARGRAHILIRTSRGGWRLPIAPADLTWARLLFGRVAAGVVRPEPTVAGAEQADSLETQERAYQERARPSSGTVTSSRGVLLLGSLAGFLASMLFFSQSLRWIAALVPILFIHELGHWLAMRAFGHRDARIAFIPLMGAATMTRQPFKKRWQEIVMLLAGPVPGIVGGMALLVISIMRHMPQLQLIAAMSVGINAINLLPLHPLDGGRILHALVTAGRPRLDLAFKTIAGLLFAVAGWTWHDPALTILGGLSLLFWPQARRLATLERRIRSTPGFDPRLPPEARRAYIFRALAHEPALKGKDWASTVGTLEGPLGYQPTPGWQIGVGVLALAALVMGGSVVASRRSSRRSANWRCPEPAGATALSCEGAAAAPIAWERSGSGAVAAFVWCAPPDARALDPDALERIGELEIASRHCAALPWTDEKGWGDAAVTRVRRTLWRLEGMHNVARADAGESLATDDPEIARLVRERSGQDVNHYLEINHEIDRRMGRSSASCGRVQVLNVEPTKGGGPASV
ncbi:MAG TPA: site-2 protease family protein [Polyangia bacterium]|nr:site-2 protease family protein [Polyangia bacterium]